MGRLESALYVPYGDLSLNWLLAFLESVTFKLQLECFDCALYFTIISSVVPLSTLLSAMVLSYVSVSQDCRTTFSKLS